MLTSLNIENYRCFKQHSISFHKTTFLVGENNAGKSTIIEALRFVGLAQRRYKTANYVSAPDWLDEEFGGMNCMRMQLDVLDLPPAGSLFNEYDGPPAKISAFFSNNTRIEIYIGENYNTYVIPYTRGNSPISSRVEAKHCNIPQIAVLPQLRQINETEQILEKATVLRDLDTNRSSIHFRNEIRLFKNDFFEEFKNLANNSWETGWITEFYEEGMNLGLNIREGTFEGEIGWMGSGLKMWLQILWFLAKSKNAETIVLDEPDIHLHPDLQRKIAKTLISGNSQTILTTHSTELLSEASPDDVLIVNKKLPKSDYATNIIAVQRILEKMGSTHNIQLTRLWNARKILVVEGFDVDALSRLHKILFPNSKLPIENIPNFSVGGYGGWEKVIGSKELLKNSLDDEIKIYCIFDRDYHDEKELNERRVRAKSNNIELHIWQKKEIENYIILPIPISKAINFKLKGRKTEVKQEEVRKAIEESANKLKNITAEKIADSIAVFHKEKSVRKILEIAREIVDKSWNTLDDKVSIISGKDLLSLIFKWAQDNYKVSLNQKYLMSFIESSDISDEVKSVLTAIEHTDNFTV